MEYFSDKLSLKKLGWLVTNPTLCVWQAMVAMIQDPLANTTLRSCNNRGGNDQGARDWGGSNHVASDRGGRNQREDHDRNKATSEWLSSVCSPPAAKLCAIRDSDLRSCVEL
jgi:hypothetical protein